MAVSFDFDAWQGRLAALELANEVGKQIMKLVSKEPFTATQISEKLELPISTVLFHLTRLELIGLVESFHFYGKRMREVRYYRTAASSVTFRLDGGEKHE